MKCGITNIGGASPGFAESREEKVERRARLCHLPGGRTVARVLQEFGAVDMDNAGGNALYGEGLWGHPAKCWQGLLDPFSLKSIAMEHYRILKLGEIIPLGDARSHRSGK